MKDTMLAEWLREAMKAEGVSQAEMGRRLTVALGRSIDRAAMNKMLSGGRKISADELMAAAKILNRSPPEEPLEDYQREAIDLLDQLRPQQRDTYLAVLRDAAAAAARSKTDDAATKKDAS